MEGALTLHILGGGFTAVVVSSFYIENELKIDLKVAIIYDNCIVRGYRRQWTRTTAITLLLVTL